MSAYTTERSAAVISISNTNGQHSTTNSESILGKLDHFIVAAQQLEKKLSLEVEKNQLQKKEIEKIKAENQKLSEQSRSQCEVNREQREKLSQWIAAYGKIKVDSESRMQKHSDLEIKLRQSIKDIQEQEKANKIQLAEKVEALNKTVAELKQYQSAWLQVQKRERDARAVLQEFSVMKIRITELENNLHRSQEQLTENAKSKEQIERHAKSYQLELQNTLLRLHSAEARFNELNKEYQLVSQSRRNMDAELKKIESTMRERIELEMANEKEQVKAELERRFSDERHTMTLSQGEIEKEKEIFREKAIRYHLELERAKTQIKETNELRELAQRNQVEAEARLNEYKTQTAAFDVNASEMLKRQVTAQIQTIDQLREDRAVLQKKCEEFSRSDIFDRLKDAEKKCADLEYKLKHQAIEMQHRNDRRIEEVILAEREKSANLLSQNLAKKKFGFFGSNSPAVQSPHPNKKITKEDYCELYREVKSFEQALFHETQRSKGLQDALAAEKNRFKQLESLLPSQVIVPLPELPNDGSIEM